MKLTLTDVKSGYNLTPLNTNFEAIEQELQNRVLYRDNPVRNAWRFLNGIVIFSTWPNNTY